MSPSGEYLASGDEQGNVLITDARTGRVKRKYKFEGMIDDVEWNTNPEMGLIGVINEEKVHIIAPRVYSKVINENTDKIIRRF